MGKLSYTLTSKGGKKKRNEIKQNKKKRKERKGGKENEKKKTEVWRSRVTYSKAESK